MEVGTHSPWISRLLKSKGLAVTVANARKLRAIYQNVRKSDELDARMLAKLLRVDRDLLSPIEHGSAESQEALVVIKLRDTLVRQRASIIGSVRGVAKSLGLRFPSTSTACFHKKAATFLEDHPNLEPVVTPSLRALEVLTEQIAEYDAQIAEAIKNIPQAQTFQEIPSIGPITALAFTLYMEDPSRFDDPRDVGPYLGLIPKRDQSGQCDKQLPITKAGNTYLRRLLVQCAQYLLGEFGPDCALRDRGLKLVERGGRAAKKKAIIAIARKLAVMMVAMWQKGTTYQPYPNETKIAA